MAPTAGKVVVLPDLSLIREIFAQGETTLNVIQMSFLWVFSNSASLMDHPNY